MKPATPLSLKIDLEKESKRCGTCKHCSRYEIFITRKDMDLLKMASQQILAAEPGGPIIDSECVISLLAVAESVGHTKLFCQKEGWTQFLDSCSLWQPRPQKEAKNP